MPGRDEILRSLTGAWNLFLDRPDAMRYFDVSVEGFWRSFGAVLLIVPSYFIIAAAERWRILTDAVVDDGFNGAAFLVNKSITLGFDWMALPVVFALVAGPLGFGRTYAAFVVARNWGAVLAIIPFAIVGLLLIGGVLSVEAANVISLVVLIVVIRFNYLIARRALGADIPFAIGLIIADMGLSLSLIGIFDALIPYRSIVP